MLLIIDMRASVNGGAFKTCIALTRKLQPFCGKRKTRQLEQMIYKIAYVVYFPDLDFRRRKTGI
jgi:hypothetical protein